VDGARDQLLADAGFAFDQHGDGRRRRLFGRAQHRTHGVRAGDHVGDAQGTVAATLEPLQFTGKPPGGQRIAQRHLQPFRARRLDHEVGGARPHHRHHIVDAAMGGLHDDGNIHARFAHARQHAEAVEVGHHQVEHHAVDALRPAEQSESRVAAFGDQGLIAEALDHGFEQAALNRVVVDDEHGL
jgi:hypothetical protein